MMKEKQMPAVYRKKKTRRSLKPKLTVPIAGKDYELNLPGDALSYSQISRYLGCGIRYEFEYVQGLKPAPTVHQVEGSILAKALEASNKRFMAKEKHLNRAQARKAYSEAFAELSSTIEDWLDQTPPGVRQRGLNFIDEFWGEEGPPMEPEAAEDVWNIEIAGVPVTGITDLVEPGNVTDFKVGKDARYYDPTKSLQLALYSLVHRKLRVGFIIFQKKDGRIVEKYETIEPDETKRIVGFTVARVAQAISAGAFPPCDEGYNWCSKKWCPHWAYCKGAPGRCFQRVG